MADAAYFAGLFDGEGSVFNVEKPGKRKRNISGEGYQFTRSCLVVSDMEIAMTDEGVH